MTVWFTVKLDDRPGSLARVATALGDRGVNITGIVGVAEDTDGALMLTTSDAGRDTRGVRRPRPRRSRSTTRPAGSSPTRCRSATFDPAPPAAARWADAEAPGGRDRGDPVRHRRRGGVAVGDHRGVAGLGGRIRALATVRRIDGDPPLVEIELEVEGVTEEALVAALEALVDVRAVHLTRALDRVFGKRIIVVGGGAQVAQVALGAVSEADRHNLRGERISVDTIPLVGEEDIAAAVRAVADLPRARLLVLAGSIMGGDISVAAEELRAVGIPIIALNMVGSITDHVDLVVSDPVQAGTMAVMAVADTATFDLERQRGRRY